MRLLWLVVALSMVLPSAGEAGEVDCDAPSTAEPRSYRQITTPIGALRIRLLDRPGEAPTTVANFLAYADAGDYDGSFFNRMIPDRVIQGGGFSFDPIDLYDTVPERPPIANEPGICNVAGTLAMARPIGNMNPDTATSEWFINLQDNSEIFGGPQGYTVFAQVIAEDMPVLEALAALHREFGTLLIDDPIALRELSDDTFANVPVVEPPARPPAGWGCIGSISSDPVLITIPTIPFPIWLPEVEDNCGGDPALEEAARELMRTDMGPKMNEQLVLMTVPEPGRAWQLAAGLSTLVLVSMARGRRRRESARAWSR
jgi:cyclophilin family peptidyl-prolyl cis-trans isomerase